MTNILRYNSGAIRMYSRMSRSLWCVMKGRAVAPVARSCVYVCVYVWVYVCVIRSVWCVMKSRTVDDVVRLRVCMFVYVCVIRSL